VLKHRLAPSLSRVLAEEFGDEALAVDLVEEFLGRAEFSPTFALRLVDVAGTRGVRPSWALRRAAVLMLEGQLLAAPADDPAALAHVLCAIAADPASGLSYPPGPAVLAEGYTTRECPTFLAEVRRRLSRLARVHRRIRARRTTSAALKDFLAVARQECRLTLARYLFHPREVARRFLDQVRTSHGLTVPFDSPLVQAEAEELLRGWPSYERALVGELLAGSRVIWVDESTSSRVNALLEHPLGTVVLVVKPPGSSLEIQIKRTGQRGEHPLSVVFERNGRRVPAPHRLDGGSMGGSLYAEAIGAARLGQLYRLVHDRRAPISQTLAHRSISEVPCAGGRAQILDYFTDSDVFGDGFTPMRKAMQQAIPSFCKEWEREPLDVPGELGATVEFLSLVVPTQAFLGGSSSFRLERLAAYLDDGGPELYFQQGLGVKATPVESRRFAETLLDEVLGEFTPVDVDYASQGRFVDAVLAEPNNRRRADAIFFDLCAEVGRFWGTLFALKGYSHGESFVGRNVGLKSAWQGGVWRVQIIFMDHDLLTIPQERFSPAEVLRGCRRDATHILGQPSDGRKSILAWLALIYRLDPSTADGGRSVLLRAAHAASRRTREWLTSDARAGDFCNPARLQDALAWEDAAAAYLHARRIGRDNHRALNAAAAVLAACGRPEDVINAHVDAIRDYAEFLEGHAALLGVEIPTST
jgi:hypothetical protein